MKTRNVNVNIQGKSKMAARELEKEIKRALQNTLTGSELEVEEVTVNPSNDKPLAKQLAKSKKAKGNEASWP